MIGVEHFPIIVVVMSLLSAYTILVAGWFNRKACFPISLMTLIAQLSLAVLILHRAISAPIIYKIGGWMFPWGIVYVVDVLNAFVLLVILFIGVLCVIYGWKNLEKEIGQRKIVTFYVILQLYITGLCGIVVTGDLFNLYVFLEITSLSSYALIASAGGRALKASFNYLVMGSIGACFYLLGVGFLYAVTGHLTMESVKEILPLLGYGNKMVQAAFVFILIGFSIKMALFPLHIWQPDAYSYAPSTVSALIAATSSKVSIYALMRVLLSVFTLDFITNYVGLDILICWIAAIGIIAGSLFAIMQRNIKRMLAYSSVSQIGYIMLGLGLTPLSPWGLVGAVAHILNHAIMKCCLFMSVGGFFHRLKLLDINNFNGLGRKMPWTSAFFTVAALSMIGVPPTTGFASKLFLLIASAEAAKTVSSGYAFIAVLLLSSLLNLVYFWRVIERMYFIEPHSHHDISGSESESKSKSGSGADGIPRAMLFSMFVLASSCIILGILWLTFVPQTIVHNLCAMFGLPQLSDLGTAAAAAAGVEAVGGR